MQDPNAPQPPGNVPPMPPPAGGAPPAAAAAAQPAVDANPALTAAIAQLANAMQGWQQPVAAPNAPAVAILDPMTSDDPFDLGTRSTKLRRRNSVRPSKLRRRNFVRPSPARHSSRPHHYTT